uniref:Mdm4 protein n=1 Tax=Lethenteron camtschaticum TaxID=980415 RepID=A0A0U4CIK7_LETCA|nr:Mdm4 protein [Lethenteron camtschaticum]
MMSGSPSISMSSASGVCEEALAVRPVPLLLRLLRSVGATGDTFTLPQVFHHLGGYIKTKQLYDKRRLHIVHCKGDPLGELFGVESFSLKEPSSSPKSLGALLAKALGRAATDRRKGGARPRQDHAAGAVKGSSLATADGDKRQEPQRRGGDGHEEEEEEGVDDDVKTKTSSDAVSAAPSAPASSDRDVSSSGSSSDSSSDSSSGSSSSGSSSSSSDANAACLACLVCLVCQHRPRSCTLVHGETGHLVTCCACAKKLKRRNEPCPACGRPVHAVVRTYLL